MKVPSVVRLRPATPEDQEFLHQVYASTREEELARVPWSLPQKDAFLRMQTRAQRAHYQSVYPDAHYQVVEVDGVGAGRLLVNLGASDVFLVDLGLLRAFRGLGVGTAVLRDLQAQAAQRKQPLSLSTELHNPARRLYLRLGFVMVEQGETHVRLLWRP